MQFVNCVLNPYLTCIYLLGLLPYVTRIQPNKSGKFNRLLDPSFDFTRESYPQLVFTLGILPNIPRILSDIARIQPYQPSEYSLFG